MINYLRKHIAFFSLWVLLLPTFIQLHHAFEEHHHDIICTATKEHHFHKKGNIDCSQLHYQLQVFYSDIKVDLNILLRHFYLNNFNEQPQKCQVAYISYKASRAPPYV